MATEKLQLSALDVNSNVTWTNESNAFSEDDTYAASSDISTQNNYYGGGNFANITETPSSLTDFKVRFHDLNTEHSNDTYTIDIYNPDTTAWETLETFDSGNLLPSTQTTKDYTTAMQSKFNAATDKTAFLNGLQIRFYGSAKSQADDNVNIALAWANFTYFYNTQLAASIAGGGSLSGTLKKKVSLTGTISGISSISPKLKLGPIEDYTTFSYADPFSAMTRTKEKVTMSNSWQPRSLSDTLLYKDKGANFFSGDFKHDFKLKFTDFSGTTPYGVCWGIANAQDDFNGIRLVSGDYQGLIAGYTSSQTSYFFQPRICEDGTENIGSNVYVSVDTEYFITIERDDDGGANGTGQLTFRIYTVNYYGQPGATEINTQTLDCGSGEQNDFQYIYQIANYSIGGSPAFLALVVEDLNLHVTAGPVSLSATISAVGGIVSSLSRDMGLSATIAGTSDLSADSKADKMIASIIAAAGGLDGDLSVTTMISIAATIAASGDLAAAAKVNRRIAALIQAASSINAALTADKKLASTIAGSSDMSAVLSLSRALSATIAGSGSLTGSLQVPGIVELAAVISALGGIVASLSADKKLSGQIAGAGDLSGDIKSNRAIAASIAATSDLSGTILARNSIDATIAASGDLVAALSASMTFAAIITAQGDLIGDLSALNSVSAQIAAQGDLAGALTVFGGKPLASTISATGSLIGSLTGGVTVGYRTRVFGKKGGSYSTGRSIAKPQIVT